MPRYEKDTYCVVTRTYYKGWWWWKKPTIAEGDVVQVMDFDTRWGADYLVVVLDGPRTNHVTWMINEDLRSLTPLEWLARQAPP